VRNSAFLLEKATDGLVKVDVASEALRGSHAFLFKGTSHNSAWSVNAQRLNELGVTKQQLKRMFDTVVQTKTPIVLPEPPPETVVPKQQRGRKVQIEPVEGMTTLAAACYTAQTAKPREAVSARMGAVASGAAVPVAAHRADVSSEAIAVLTPQLAPAYVGGAHTASTVTSGFGAPASMQGAPYFTVPMRPVMLPPGVPPGVLPLGMAMQMPLQMQTPSQFGVPSVSSFAAPQGAIWGAPPQPVSRGTLLANMFRAGGVAAQFVNALVAQNGLTSLAMTAQEVQDLVTGLIT